METHSSLPGKPRGPKSAKLIVEPMGRASGSTDARQSQLASQIVGRGSKLDLGTLGPDGFGGEVSEEKARIDTVRKPDVSRSGHSKRIPTVDALEPVAFGSAMGEGREDQEAWHEAQGTSRSGINRFE